MADQPQQIAPSAVSPERMAELRRLFLAGGDVALGAECLRIRESGAMPVRDIPRPSFTYQTTLRENRVQRLHDALDQEEAA